MMDFLMSNSDTSKNELIKQSAFLGNFASP